MLWPNATSSPEQPRNAPAFSWARSTSAVVRRDVSYGAPTLALSCAQVAGDRVDHLVGALRSAWAVEEREPALQGGEAGANGGDVEQGGTHESSSPLTVQW